MKARQWTVGFACLAWLGCGSGGGSTFDNPGASGAGAGGLGSGARETVPVINVEPFEPNVAVGDAGNADGAFEYNLGDLQACAKGMQAARLSPVNLVFIYDKSGSMGDPADGFDPNQRWNPVKTGMLSFFSDPASSSLRAALTFFPVYGDLTAACTGPYDDPVAAVPPGLPLTSLVSAEIRQTFGDLLTSTKPKGGTPTLPALLGGISQAKRILQDRPYETTVVVLVTDGQPGFYLDGAIKPGCSDNDLSHVSDAAAQAFKGSPSIPVYVIGIGPDTGNMDQIATSGGTGKAMMISADPNSDPAVTAATFRAALEAIRTVTFSCEFPLPPPPDGMAFNRDEVNVNFTSSTGTTTIARDSTCGLGGWRYDNDSNPTKIELCPKTCSEIQADTSGKIQIVFGCQTEVVDIR